MDFIFIRALYRIPLARAKIKPGGNFFEYSTSDRHHHY